MYTDNPLGCRRCGKDVQALYEIYGLCEDCYVSLNHRFWQSSSDANLNYTLLQTPKEVELERKRRTPTISTEAA